VRKLEVERTNKQWVRLGAALRRAGATCVAVAWHSVDRSDGAGEAKVKNSEITFTGFGMGKGVYVG
jgi:hypothetical protein